MTLTRDTLSQWSKPLSPRQMDRFGVGLLCLSHGADDIFQGTIPIMLPFFIAAHGLSYSAAAGLVLALTLSSSIIQPFLGQFSDRHSAPWLVPAGIVLAAGGVALACLMPTYTLIALSVGLSGVGLAAFHPEAARFVNHVAGARQATAMSIFSVGGSLGLAIGPLLATPLMLTFGLGGAAFLFVPAAATAAVMTTQLPRFAIDRRPAQDSGSSSARKRQDAWGPFLRLTCAVIGRSVLFYGLATFTPLYWQHVLHQSVAAAGVALTVLFVSGGAGTIVAGWSADRYGWRRVVLASMGASAILLAVFVSLRDPIAATLLLVPVGMTVFAPASVMVVIGQEYLPNRIGTASGVTQGIAVSAGGLAAPLLGRVADAQGISAVLTILIFIPLLAMAFVGTLPAAGRNSAASA